MFTQSFFPSSGAHADVYVLSKIEYADVLLAVFHREIDLCCSICAVGSTEGGGPRPLAPVSIICPCHDHILRKNGGKVG